MSFPYTNNQTLEIELFLKGIVIGFSIAAPVGPIGVLCIHRTLSEGSWAGLASGLGAATADAIYGCIAGLGLTFISHTLANHKIWLSLIGGLFLCYLGIKTYLTRPADESAKVQSSNLITAYTSTFMLTLTNPVTIAAFAAIFAGLGAVNTQGSYIAAGILVTGVFLGSAFWWTILSVSIGLFRAKFNSHRLQWVNRIAGITIMGFGVSTLLQMI